MTQPQSFSQEGKALLNNVLNRWVFSLWRPLAWIRFAFFVLLSLFFWHKIGNRYQPLEIWPYLIKLSHSLRAGMVTSLQPLLPLLKHFFNLPTLRDLVPLIIPFLVMRFRAGAYLDDIFELDDIQVAVRFADSTVFGIRYDTIEIENGEVHRISRNSPILRIGGPGFVRLSLDSAALFEYADGRPHPILPRAQKNEKGLVPLDGFERLRATFDLRDHIVPFNVSERTLDGIRIEARDVRLVFSLWRCGRESTLEEPYPVAARALTALTYSQTATVGQPSPRVLTDVQWRRRMQGLISGQLRHFISHTPLDEFIVSIGDELFPGVDKNASPGDAALSQERSYPRSRPEIKGHIAARPDLPNYFLLFSQNFNANAARNGVELRWSGIGTWVIPDDAINRKNEEAWRISRYNLIRTSAEWLQQHREQYTIRTMRDLVQQYILHPYKNSRGRRSKRWQQVLYRLIILFSTDAIPAYQAQGVSPQQAKRAADYLHRARSYIINDWQAPEDDIFSAAANAPVNDDEEAAVQEQAREEEERLYRLLLDFISEQDIERAIKVLQRQYPEHPRFEHLSRLGPCLAAILQEAERAGQKLSREETARRLNHRLENLDC